MSKNILIVDDDPNMLKMVGMTLKQAGYEISIAKDAQAASLQINKVEPDLIILDIMMPGISGIDFLQALRADPKGIRIPVILLSALADVDDKIAGFKAGADEYIIKPVDARELLARVSSLLARTEALMSDQKVATAKLISVLGVKGGVGTSTVLINLAGVVAEQGYSTIVTELHSSAGTLSKTLGQNRGGTIGDLLARNADKVNPKTLEQILFQHPTKLRLLSHPVKMDPDVELTQDFLASLLESLNSMADLVLLDLSSRIDPITRAVLEDSDIVILVLEPSQVFIDAAVNLVPQIQEIASQVKSIGAVIVNRSGLASSASKDEVAEQIGIPIFGSLPQAGDVLGSAYRRGHLLITEQPTHMASEAFRQIATKAILSEISKT